MTHAFRERPQDRAILEEYPNAELSNRRRFSHTVDGKVFACPDCDDTHVRFRILKRPRFACNGCGAEFSDPVERGSKNLSYTAGRVPEAPDDWLEADPEEVDLG